MTNSGPPRGRHTRPDDGRRRETTPAPYTADGYDDRTYDRGAHEAGAPSEPPRRTAPAPPHRPPPPYGPPVGRGRHADTPGRSRWVTGDGIDTSGRQVIDVGNVGPAGQPRPSRRNAMIGMGALAAGAVAALVPQGLDLGSRLFGGAATDPERENGSAQGVALQSVVRGSPTEAAAAVTEVTPSPLGSNTVLHLVSRLTFGATPSLVAEVRSMGIDAWIAAQLEPERIDDSALNAKLAELTTLNKSIDELRAEREANDAKRIRPAREWAEATIARQIWSKRQLFEVMVDFWNDFLHVAADIDNGAYIRGPFDRDVIRRYALDNYPDMFVAANRHPALLRYLDQDRSRKNAINENLARENLELYSVGVDGGYTEDDVLQAAILQTGHSIRDDQYVYRPDQHVTGPVRIMRFKHPNSTPEGGEEAAERYFRYLALHPSTARYIAQNLATRLVSDTPPAALVDAVATTYLEHKGAIKPTLMTLLSSTGFWAAVGQKVRRPAEYLVATYRALGVSPATPATFDDRDPNASPFLQGLRQLCDFLVGVAHWPAGHPTPDGYPDVFVAWTSAGTMIRLWNEALNIINGGRKMFTYLRPDELAGPKPPTAAGDYVEALARNLISRPLAPRERDLLLGVAGVDAAAPVDASLNGAVGAVARAIFASPLHHLR